MQKWLLQLYLISDRTVWPVLDKGWTWNIIDIKCVMLLINISGILSWFVEEGELVWDGNLQNHTFKKVKERKKGPRVLIRGLGANKMQND